MCIIAGTGEKNWLKQIEIEPSSFFIVLKLISIRDLRGLETDTLLPPASF